MVPNDKKKYSKMEICLQHINKNFVTVSEEDTKKANPLLKHVIDTMIKSMQKVSPLFDNMFESVLYGGSFFDGLKVGKPEEFDIDLKLVLPKLVAPKLSLSNQPGFVTVQLTGWSTFEKSNECAKYKGLSALKDEKDFLVVNKVLQWIESVVNLAMNDIGKIDNKAIIRYNGKDATVAIKKSGPAMTALITYEDIYMDVDFVLVFKLMSEHWPPSPFRPLPKECNGKKEFLIVPKTPKIAMDKKERCWRMSFQEQEKVLILGNNTCKPALRLLKKLRDTQNHNMISSYFLKTVFLHEIEKQDKLFWNAPLGFIFMHMLKSYRDYLNNYKIPYYWNKNNNLLAHIDKITIDNFKNFLNRVIDNVDKKLEENPYIIGEYICTSDECIQLKRVNFGFSVKCNAIDNTTNSNNITESQSVDIPIMTLSSSNIITPVAKKNNSQVKNDSIVSLLTDIQNNVLILKSDMNLALLKISVLEKLALELKNDNEDFKDTLKKIEIVQKVENNTNDDILKTDSCKTNELSERLECLYKSLEKIKKENYLLKTSLKQFVLSE